MKYQGKELTDFSYEELEVVLKYLQSLEDARNLARSHKKFEKMDFPPPNSEFLNLKKSIEDEIRKKQNA